MGHEREPIFVGPHGKESRSAGVENNADEAAAVGCRNNTRSKKIALQQVAAMVDCGLLLHCLPRYSREEPQIEPGRLHIISYQ